MLVEDVIPDRGSVAVALHPAGERRRVLHPVLVADPVPLDHLHFHAVGGSGTHKVRHEDEHVAVLDDLPEREFLLGYAV